MSTFNTSEIFKAAHKKTAYEFRMSRGRCFYYSKLTYRQILSEILKVKWSEAKKEVEPIETFTIALEYADFDSRVTVKKMGGKWNADSKTWTVVCRKSDLGKLASKVKTNSTRVSPSTKGVYNTGFGYYGTVADAKRGYDGIE